LNGAPGTLDTLLELANALGSDPNFATTITGLIGQKLAKASNLSDLTDAAAARGNLGLGSAAVETAANLLARANHTGTQLAATVSDFNSAALAAAPAETANTVGTLVSGATAKTTPVDADNFGYSDSAASNVFKRFSWANFKAVLKTYFDTIYQAALGYTAENVANKSTSVATDAASDTKYPSVKAVANATRGNGYIGMVKAVETISNLTLSGLQTVDFHPLLAGERVFLTMQTDATQNGVWVVSAGAWTRPVDFAAGSVHPSGALIYVSEGTQMRSSWMQLDNANDDSIAFTVGTDPLNSLSRQVPDLGETERQQGPVLDMKNWGRTDIASALGRGRALALESVDMGGFRVVNLPPPSASSEATTKGYAENASNLASGTLPAARMPALTGDVTTSAGAVATAIANDAVTNAKLANMATQTIRGRTTAGTGDPEDLSVAQVKTMLSLSGTNTGDQSSIVGITGTTAQFNTALTDNDFATLAGSETLTNKTLTGPVMTTPTLGVASATSVNTALLNPAGNAVEQYNSTSAQSLRVYNTRTDASNYERGELSWVSNTLRFGTFAAGTGGNRNVDFYRAGTLQGSLQGTSWRFNVLVDFASDNSTDIGQSASNRPRSGYFGTSVRSPKFETAASVQWTSGTGSPEGVVTAAVGSLFTRTDGGTGTTLYVKESGVGNTGWVAK
jgi:hypothetical protein